MKQIINTHQQVNTIRVDRKSVNDAGMLTTCKLLEEVTRANDRAIVRAFGLAGFGDVRVVSYQVDIPGAALLGDKVTMASDYSVSPTGLLEVVVTIHKEAGRKYKTLLNGTFIFTHASNHKQ